MSRQIPKSRAEIYNYKYNGKELQETGMYDYGARMYMPDIGRWTTLDPLAEFQRKINPYAYCYNNPVNFYDPTGMIGEGPGDPVEIDPNKPGGANNPIQIQEVVLQGKKKTSTTDKVLAAAEWTPIPFVGSGIQFFNAARKGDGWGMAMGATFLVVDAFTLGEGGEALRLSIKAGEEVAELSAKEALKIAAEDEVKTEAEQALKEAIEKHHSDPKFLGGEKGQELTEMSKSDHGQLHKDLNDHLFNEKNIKGEHMRPQRNNSGTKIINNFGRNKALQVLKNFYKGNGAVYKSAAKDFFKQHPNL